MLDLDDLLKHEREIEGRIAHLESDLKLERESLTRLRVAIRAIRIPEVPLDRFERSP